jgi:hypothetical protein
MKTKFFKLGILMFLLLFIVPGCNKKDDTPPLPPPCACGIENPQENLEWLKNDLERSFYTEVYSIQYKANEYIGIFEHPSVRDGGIGIYNCQGEMFCEYIGIAGWWTCEKASEDEFIAALENKVLIYVQTDNPIWDD